jgi:multidrug efflux pump subunit AcrA (membrane-fusion protein)
MTCSIEIVSYRNDKALVAPSSAVFAEDGDPDSRYVHVIREGKKPLKRKVKVGKESGGKTEILGGLKRGQEILVEKPKK